ncbi:hypothetical protein [Polaribacter cellanae]|uniref:Uncharacterized protein n=1 Tax=Polaribacter cellanae TaxID=2818493 RepID=A0A975CKQ3_9FLAO|nr:hypothetical protein [Polaribacter cellanae]QTE21498.1 hypothetical protein J3359_11760 [Polaribacter cellanae]
MKSFINKSKLIFFTLFLLGLIVSILGVFILPERFFYDTAVLIEDKHNEIGLIGSYPFTIWFYHITGLKNLHFAIIGALQYSVVIYILYKIGIPKRFQIVNVKNVLVYLSFIILAVFLCMPSKEFINFLYLSIIVFILQKNIIFYKKIIFCLLLVFFFGIFFRPYFILVAVLTPILFLINKVKLNNKKTAIFFYGLLVTIMMSLSYGFLKGEFMSQSSREYINNIRDGGKATNSVIVSPVDTNKWYGETVGIMYGFFSVNLPLNSFKHIFKPQIIMFIFWQLLMLLILLIRYDKTLKKGTYKNTSLWVFNMVFSYFMIQGVFEPDLGSAIRHKMGVFPLIYFILYYDSFR